MAIKINDINQARNAVNRVFNGVDSVDAALFANEPSESARVTFDIPLDSIQARPINEYAIVDIEQLASSIERTGLWQPIIVRNNPGNGKPYVIVAGERRYTAMTFLRDKYRKAGDIVKADLFSTIAAYILKRGEDGKEEDIYHDTNDFSRQITNFERILRLDPQAIDMSKESWQEKYLMLCHPDKLEDYRGGRYECKGNLTEKCEYLKALILEREPNVDITEKTIRIYLAFIDRCGDDLRYAVMKGKISLRVAMSSLSFLPRTEQTLAISAVGTDKFNEYVEKGKQLSGDETKPQPKAKPKKTVRQQLDDTTKSFVKMRKAWIKSEKDREGLEAKTEAEQEYIDRVNEVFRMIEDLENFRKEMSKN